jgi:hypothetical protein
LAVSAVALVGLAPAAAAADSYLIGSEDFTLIHLCLRLSGGPDRTCIAI